MLLSLPPSLSNWLRAGAGAAAGGGASRLEIAQTVVFVLLLLVSGVKVAETTSLRLAMGEGWLKGGCVGVRELGAASAHSNVLEGPESLSNTTCA